MVHQLLYYREDLLLSDEFLACCYIVIAFSSWRLEDVAEAKTGDVATDSFALVLAAAKVGHGSASAGEVSAVTELDL